MYYYVLLFIALIDHIFLLPNFYNVIIKGIGQLSYKSVSVYAKLNRSILRSVRYDQVGKLYRLYIVSLFIILNLRLVEIGFISLIVQHF